MGFGRGMQPAVDLQDSSAANSPVAHCLAQILEVNDHFHKIVLGNSYRNLNWHYCCDYTLFGSPAHLPEKCFDLFKPCQL